MTLHDHIYSNFNISISFKLSITFAESTGNLGSVRGRSLKAGSIRRLWRQQCLVLSFFLSFWQHVFFTCFPTSDLAKLGHSDRLLNHYSRTNNDGVRCHDVVTGVKKVLFTKKASSPTECVALTSDLCICITLTPSTKVITLKIHPESLGVTGVKRSFSLKKASSPTECVALVRDSCIYISLTPSTKVITLKNCPGSFGVTGVKRSFSLKLL